MNHRLVLIALTLSRAPSQDAENDTMERMRFAYEQLEGLEAELTQIVSYPQLGLTDPPEEGFLQVDKKPRGIDVRLEMTQPEQRILVVNDGEYTFYQPRIRQAILGRATESGAARAGFLKFLLGDLSDAEKEFVLEVTDESAEIRGRDTTHLRLTPRQGSASEYARIELWVDEELGLPIQEKLVERNGDEVLVRLENVRVNPPTEAFDFELELPKDVERIRR